MEKKINNFFEKTEKKILISDSERESVKDQLLDYLKQNKIFIEKFDERNRQRYKIFDLEHFLDPEFQKNAAEFLHNRNREMPGGRYLIFELLKDFEVISKTDSEKNPEAKPQPLFNYPKNIEEAVDPRTIKEKQYYLDYWDIVGQGSHMADWNRKLMLESGEAINLKEHALAVLLFRKMNAKREKETSELMVNDGRGGRTKINVDIILDYAKKMGMGHLGSASEQTAIDDPQNFLKKYCPHILESGLVKADDFQILTSGRSGELIRKEKTVDKNNKLEIMANGARYYFGREKFIVKSGGKNEEYDTRDLKITILDDKYLGIIKTVKGYASLLYKVRMLSDGEKAEKAKEIEIRDGKKYSKTELALRTLVNKEEIIERLEKWDVHANNLRRPDESESNYNERMNKIQNYEFIKKIEQDFALKCDLGIHHLSWREQQWLASACFEMGSKNYEKLLAFGAQYGLTGLKTFLSCEFDIKNGQKILDIGEKLNPEQAGAVFGKLSEIIDLAEKKNEELGKLVYEDEKNVDTQDIKFRLLDRARNIIVNFGEKLSGKKTDQDQISQLLSDLEKTKTEVILLVATFKSAKAQGENIDWEKIRNFGLEIKDFGAEFDKETKQEMLFVAERNWRQNEKLKDAVIAGFGDSLSNTENQKFYVLKYQGKIVSFVRFQKTESEKVLYAGSFNVDPEARGIGVGEEMMNRALVKEGKTHVLEATVSPRIIAGTCYVEKIGFVVDGIIADYHHTGESLFSIRLDGEQNKKYIYRNEGKENKIIEEQIKKQCFSQENIDPIIGAETIVLKFDMQNDFEKMKEAMRKLLIAKDDEGKDVPGQNVENKYIITRYFKDKEEKEKDIRYFVLEKIIAKIFS